MSERSNQVWLALFRSGNLDVKDAPRSGRPVTGKVDDIMKMVELNQHARYQEIEEASNLNHITVWNHLKRASSQRTSKFANCQL